MIQLRLLGASEIRIGRKVIAPSAEVVFAFGVYCCVRAGDRIPRADVSETFWGAGEGQGRHSLRQMLYRLRQKGFVLDEEGEELYLDPARVDSDLATALAEGWPETAIARDVEAAGQFAPSFTRVISERFTAWWDGVRDRLASQHRRACLHQISQARREGRWADLDRWALQILKLDPLNEEATLARAESAAVSGSKAVALEILDSYIEELGDRASAIGLPANVLRRRIAERGPEWRRRGPSEVPLVGRQDLMARLTGYVDAAARSEGRALLLWGPPGIGKSRLAEETRTYASLRGFRAASARASSASSNRPFGVITTLVAQLLDFPGALGCNPDALSILRQVAARPSTHGSSELQRSNSIRETIGASLIDLIDAITQEGRLLLFLDDVHHVDPASGEVLAAIAQVIPDRRVLQLSTSRVRLATSHQVAVHVAPLSEADSLILTSLVASLRPPVSRYLDADSVVATAGGNPLFLRELALHSATGDGDLLPRSLLEVIGERLEALEPDQLRLLRLICTLGSQLSSIPRLASLHGATSRLGEQLEALDEMGIVRMGPQRTVELHDCWQQAISDGIRPVVRSALAHECGNLLAAESPLTAAAAWRAASLFRENHEHSRALAMLRSCAEDLLARGLPADATAVLKEALAFADERSQRAELLVLKGWAERAAGAFGLLVSTCQEALPLVRPEEPTGATQHAQLVLLEAEALIKTNEGYSASLERLSALVTNELVDWRLRQQICAVALGLVHTDRSAPLSRYFLEQTQRITRVFGPSTDGLLAELVFYAETGDREGVLATENQLRALESEVASNELECRSLRFRAMAQRIIGNLAEAQILGERCYQASFNGALLDQRATICDVMIHSALDRDDTEGAQVWMDRLRSIRLPIHPHRERSFTHDQARLLAHQGRYQEAIQVLDRLEPVIASDTLMRRKGVDLALIAFAAAMSGDRERSAAAANLLERICRNDRASLQIDNCTEWLLRTYDALGKREQRDEVGVSYARRRSIEFPVPVAPYFSTLATYVARVVARQDD